jgi:Putative bacterial sensory transduction regulator
MGIVARAILVVAALAIVAAAYAQPRPGGRGPSGGGGGGGGGGAPGGLIVKIQAQNLAQLMNDAGFASKLIDNSGPVVLVAFWNDQIFSGAIPQACEKDGSGCHSFKLFANLGKDTGVDQAWINAWNNSYYYVRAFKLQDGQLIFEWNVALLTGVTADYIKLAAIAFKSAVDESTNFKPQ